MTACSLSVLNAERLAAESKFFGKKSGQAASAARAGSASDISEQQLNQLQQQTTTSTGPLADKQIKLSYFSSSWDNVFKDVAKQSGRTLVMDKFPKGRYSRNDWSRYSLDETLRILNRELEPQGYRVLARGEVLNVVFLQDVRQDYSRPLLNMNPTVVDNTRDDTPDSADNIKPSKVSKPGIAGVATATPSRKPKASSIARTRNANGVQQASFIDLEEEDDDDENDGDDVSKSSHWVEVSLKNQSAKDVSKSLYQAFLEQAEIVEQGPNGLPGFVVWQTSGRSLARGGKTSGTKNVRFAVGIDTKQDRLLIDGSPVDIANVKKLVTRLDVAAGADDRTVRLIASNRDVRQVAQALKPAVKQITQNDSVGDDATGSNDEQSVAKPKAKTKGATKATPKAQPKENPAPKANSKNAKPDSKSKSLAPATAEPEMEEARPRADVPAIIGGLKGDVNVEALDDLGVLILRGNEQDVESVMSIIRQIEKLSQGTVPDIHVRMLEHVDSESLAELLTSVYERLNRSRGRTTTDASQQVSVIAIGKPNSVMILASEADMEAVNELIEKLDQPIDPATEFEVFRLRYGVASQVVSAIDSFFGSGGSSTAGTGTGTTQGTSSSRTTTGGLRGRVKAISDSRTNSVIVQARPRDLEEVQRLISELDQAGSNSVNQIKLIPLKNAVADEMAELLNLAIQSVISPPQQVRTQQGGGGGGFGNFGGGGGQGQVDQKLRDAKSAVLQLLDGENGEQMIESGILADIRINSDLRTNSLVVTAPQESLALIQALVKKFDQPASLVAEIKHFTLLNADAESVSTMLNQLFNNQQQQGGRQGGGANQQNQQLGIQLAGAEDASSQLIPLRLSTDIRTNSIIAVGGAEALSVIEAIILRLDENDMRQRKMTVYRLKNSPSTQVAQSITAFLQSQSSLAQQANQGLVSNFEQFEREVIVVAESNSNSLLISATPRYYDDIMEIVERIDADQKQVVIQALLVEVELSNNDEFGVELGLQDSLLFDRSGTATVNNVANTLIPGFNFNNQPLGNVTGTNKTAIKNTDKVGGQGLSSFSVGRTNDELGFGGLVLSAGSESVNVLLRALSANRRLEILSRPQIRTLDNQLGRINVGQNVPVVSGFTTNGALGQISPTVTRDDSGIILEVTPRITPDGHIVMQIGAERSNYDLINGVTLTTDANGNQIQAPVKNISRAVSTISVSDEQTVVLGGLIQKREETLERKVPWLGDVPILGRAFRFDAQSMRRTELLIFLTPRIIKNDSVNEIIKQVEAERLHYTECEAEALHGPLFVAPAPPSDGSVPPLYQPGGIMSPSNSQPLPPAPMPNGNSSTSSSQGQEQTTPPRLSPAPPSSNEQSAVQDAMFEFGSKAKPSKVQPVSTAGTAKASRKPTVIDSLRRKPSSNRQASNQ